MKYIPNILTIIRFLLIFIYLAIFYSSHAHSLYYAIFIFLIAGFTDVLDEYYARKYNIITKFGQVMDPLADKSIQLVVLLTLASSGFIQVWIVYFILFKELFMIISGTVLYFSKVKLVISSNIFGKITTILIYLVIILSVLEVTFSYILFIIVLIVSVLTLLQYCIIAISRLKCLTKNKELEHEMI